MPLASYQQTNFLAGEWSPFFQGRSDHQKYRSALNVCRNGLPMEEGAWVRRPGTRLKAPTYKNQRGRIIPVEFSTDEPYTVEFTDGALRFFQGHKFVYTTDGAQTVSSVSTASPAVLTLASAVTWATDDEITFSFDSGHPSGALALRQRVFRLTKLTTTTFSLLDALTGDDIDGSTLAMPAGATITASRILRISSPYTNGSWANCRVVQNQDMAVVLNREVAPHVLTISPGATAGQASASLVEAARLDGPYLDPIPNSEATVSGGTLSTSPWDSGTSYVKGSVVSYDGNFWLYDATLNSTAGVTPPTASSGWREISSSTAAAGISGTVTVGIAFAAWDSTKTYNVGDYVSYLGNSYQSLQGGNVNQTPSTATAYWVSVPNGTAVTGAMLPSDADYTGFQATDLGRHMRIFFTPAEWDPTVAYHTGDLVTRNNQVYLNGDPNTGDAINIDPEAGTTSEDSTTGLVWTPAVNKQKWTWGTISSVTSATSVLLQIQGDPIPVYSTDPSLTSPPPAPVWRLGVYSDTTGYPASGTFYEGRLWLGGSVKNRFDTTQSQDFDKNGILNFGPTLDDGTVTDASGISYVLQSKDANEIFWFEPDHNDLVCGTLGGEWLIQASSIGEPITPTSIRAKRVTKYGCADILPCRTGISLVFVQRYRRRVMEFLSDVFSNRYEAPHLNEAAKHLTKDGVEEIAYQEELAPVVWARTGASS